MPQIVAVTLPPTDSKALAVSYLSTLSKNIPVGLVVLLVALLLCLGIALASAALGRNHRYCGGRFGFVAERLTVKYERSGYCFRPDN